MGDYRQVGARYNFFFKSYGLRNRIAKIRKKNRFVHKNIISFNLNAFHKNTSAANFFLL